MIDEKRPADAFLTDTALTKSLPRRAKHPTCSTAEPYKSYPDAPKYQLPRSSWNLDEARLIPLLQRRRSTRQYLRTPLAPEQLAFLLWASQGVTARTGSRLLRTAPSAGACYPIETYLFILNVDGFPPGLYHFDIQAFQLELLNTGFQGEALSRTFLDQHWMADASACLVWTAIPGRSVVRYGTRGIRYLLLDAAHICQNVLLAAEAVGFSGCPVGAFYDDAANDLLGIDGVQETVLYGATIGKKKMRAEIRRR